ncbi:unnamed protein product [Cladocopium goreaui]|uniref:7,8-didemethyl-8-hydroxy-5-deazariboflavin synthase n=1 Tax=Cladocopium goreaui TaxID=2562237 RepID=A0A9P1CK48_9DINO|nr:unnamed protein product [Cladocopium goreaui]
MAKFITHECLAKDVLNTAFSSGVSGLEHWKDHLRNEGDGKLALLFVDRIKQDYDSSQPAMRKAVSYTIGLQKHQACGAFLHFLRMFERLAPPADYDRAYVELHKMFLRGLLDADLQHVLTTSFPPGDLSAIAAFRPYVAKVEQAARIAKEQEDLKLASDLRAADGKQVIAKIENDLRLLQDLIPDDLSQAQSTAKDLKYLRDRQEKGRLHVEKYLGERACLVEQTDTYESQHALGDFLKFKEQFRGISGQQYLIVSLDATVWPANSNYLADAVSNLSSVLALSSTHVGIVQYPVYQSQTNQMTLVKHRHTLDNLLLKAGLTAYHPLLFLYDKPDSTARDGRPMSQMAMGVFHGNFDSCAFMDSSAIKLGKLGPVPLIRIADLLGFDEVRRPGASARVEQKGIPCHDQIVDGLLQNMPIGAGDRVLFLDLLPNRQVEFGRALTERSLAGQKTDVRYFGLVPSENFKDASNAIRDMIYRAWDSSAEAPPKQRPDSDVSSDRAAPNLQILAWQNGQPVFPEPLMNRFGEETVEFQEVKKLQSRFLDMFPATEAVAPGPVVPGRASGMCDFSIDGNLEPLDIDRNVELVMVANDQFEEPRRATCAMTRKKPAIVICEDFSLWLGNTSDSDSVVEPGELLGFGTGDPSAEKDVLPWRLSSDLSLVSSDRTWYPVCKFLRKLATEQGIGELEIEDHQLEPRYHAAVDGADPVPVTFRYAITPLRSKATHVYKPNGLSEGRDQIASTMIGAVFAGNFDKLVKNKICSVVWEVQFTSSPPKIQISKPKLYMTARIHLPSKSWCCISK